MSYVPSKVFITNGYGFHRNELGSFEKALSYAGIQKQNLVYVSSILPPNCQIIDREQGVEMLEPGAISHCVMARVSTNEHGRIAGAAIGLAEPAERSRYGYLSEVHKFGCTVEEMANEAEDLAAEFLAASLDLPFDENKNWDDNKEQWRIGGKIVNSQAFTCVQTHNVENENSRWLTVITAAVFLR